MAPVRRAAMVSYRLGGTDGVSIEAAKWHAALEAIGFTVTRVAGRISGEPHPGDTVVPGLDGVGSDATGAPDGSDVVLPDPPPGTIDDAIVAAGGGCELVVMENVCSLPLHRHAAEAAARAAGRLAGAGAHVVLRHHDLPWQRPHLAGIGGFPPDIPGVLHVTVNERSRRELAARGVRAVAVHNRFDLEPEPGDRPRTRARLGFAPHDVVLLQPARAIPRKNVPAGIAFAEELDGILGGGVRYWLTGPAEDGYGPTLDGLVARAAVPVEVAIAPSPADAYAAADAVVFPSTWEGFGNPVIESVAAGRPLVVGHYPVLDEITARGLRFFAIDDPAALARWLARPDPSPLAANTAAARRHFSLEALPDALTGAFAVMGWG